GRPHRHPRRPSGRRRVRAPCRPCRWCSRRERCGHPGPGWWRCPWHLDITVWRLAGAVSAKDRGRVVAEPAPAADNAPGLDLTEAMAAVLARYEDHLAHERNLSEHTVRAYLGDLRQLGAHLVRLGEADFDAADLRSLRSWLANQTSRGQGRTTVQRRV